MGSLILGEQVSKTINRKYSGVLLVSDFDGTAGSLENTHRVGIA